MKLTLLMGGNTSKQQALSNGISNHHIKIYPTNPTVAVPKLKYETVGNDKKSQKEITRETTEQKTNPGPNILIPVNELRKETQKFPVTSLSSSYEFNLSPKPLKSEGLHKTAFFQDRSASSKIPVPKSYVVCSENPKEKILREKSKLNNPAAGDMNANYVVNSGKVSNKIKTKQAILSSTPSYSEKDTSSTTTSTSEPDPKKKLVIRGLKRFCESRGSSCPPMWVKDFPCKSKFHPDNYVYDWEEGPNAVKRNTALMSKCTKQGGRCGTCGIYAVDVCRVCRKCDLDCGCPKLPKIPEFVGQMFGAGITWPQSEKISRDFAGEEQARQYNSAPANYNPYNYSQMPVPTQCYSPYPYYSPVQYGMPTVYPGCYPAPTYMPMPMMSSQPPVPNYYNPGLNYQSNQQTTPDPNNYDSQMGQSTNPQTSFNMSFYE